jgi:branched-chain amino acid transport system permease protein
MGRVLVIGVLDGTIFGLFALAITLVYRGTGAVNFALGEVGTLSLFTAWWLTSDLGLPWIVGAAGSLATGALICVVFERLVIRPMHERSPLSVVVATIGLLTFLLFVELQLFGESPREIAPPLRGDGFDVAGVIVSPTQVLSVVLAAIVAVGLGWFLRKTDFGLGVLAAAQDPDAVRLVGVPLRRVTAFVWAVGGALAALAALLVAPSIGVIAPGFSSKYILVGALVAAVVGGLSSLWGAFAGGLAVGVLKAAILEIYADSTFPGLPYWAYLVVLLAVLLVTPNGLSALLARSRRAT